MRFTSPGTILSLKSSRKVAASIAAERPPNASGSRPASASDPRTQFRQEVNRIQEHLEYVEKEVTDVLSGIRKVWEGDFQRYRETEDEWHELDSPEPGDGSP